MTVDEICALSIPAVENALDAVRRAFGNDWTPEQGEAMDKLTDTVRAALLGKTTAAGQLGVRLDAQGQIACGQGIGTNAPAAAPSPDSQEERK